MLSMLRYQAVPRLSHAPAPVGCGAWLRRQSSTLGSELATQLPSSAQAPASPIIVASGIRMTVHVGIVVWHLAAHPHSHIPGPMGRLSYKAVYPDAVHAFSNLKYSC